MNIGEIMHRDIHSRQSKLNVISETQLVIKLESHFHVT